MLEAKSNPKQMLLKIILTHDEQAAVEEGIEFMDKVRSIIYR
jgi:hypothetical protein